MRTRLLTILDSMTEIYCLITEFEETDAEICKKIGIPTNFRILNFFSGSYIIPFAGYDFHPEYFKNRVKLEDFAGTYKATGIILKQTKNIKVLPNPMNVEEIRNHYIRMLHSRDSLLQKIMEKVNEYEPEKLRKIIFIALKSIHISIINLESKEVIYEAYSTWKKEMVLPLYLWVPLKKITDEELTEVKLSLFPIQRLDS